MNLGLEGKRALVTGGSHGIGLAIALALAREGCRIAICSRRPEKVSGLLADTSTQWDGVLVIPFDALVHKTYAGPIDRIRQQWGGLDILINNIGGGGRWGDPFPDRTKNSVWNDVMQKNFHCARRFIYFCLSWMLEARWGRVVNITSIYGREGGGQPQFAAAKAALIAMTKAFADVPFYARRGVTFNSIAPGPVMIPDTGWAKERELNPEGFATYCEALPMGRLGAPCEVANVVTFLCSERANWVNGACWAVDGGQGRAF